MTLLTFRDAAKIGGCSTTSIVRAVNSGGLKVRERDGETGFDPDEVRRWRWQRSTPAEVMRATLRICDAWTYAMRRMQSDLDQAEPGESVKFTERWLRAFFIEVVHFADIDKFPFSEGCARDEDHAIWHLPLSSDQIEGMNVEDRFIVCLHAFMADRSELTHDLERFFEWANKIVADDRDVADYFPVDNSADDAIAARQSTSQGDTDG